MLHASWSLARNSHVRLRRVGARTSLRVSGWSGPEPAAASRNDGGCTRAAARPWRHWPLQCRQVVDSGLAACSGAGAESSRMTTVESGCSRLDPRSEEHTSELQSLMRISYAVFFLQKQHIP